VDSVKSYLGVAPTCVVIQISVCGNHETKIVGMLILGLLKTLFSMQRKWKKVDEVNTVRICKKKKKKSRHFPTSGKYSSICLGPLNTFIETN
jgi:hypothetical protein